MSAFAVAAREGTRLVRSSPTRSAIVAVTIAGATALGVREGSVAVGCVALSVAVTVVARRSPRPERVMSANAWSRAGSNRFAIWMSGSVEALIVAWMGALAGGLVGIVVVHATATHAAFGDGVPVVLWQLGLLAIASCLPTTRLRASKRTRIDSAMPGASVGARVAIVVFALLLMLGGARSVRTDSGLSLTGAWVVPLLIIVGLIVTGPASNWAVHALGNVPICRSIDAIAARHRTPATVRFVIVAAVTVATVFAVLGASVQARPDTQHLLDEQLARLPVLPRNVALMRLNPDAQATSFLSIPAFAPGLTSSELNDIRVAIANAVPGAEVIELHSLGERVTSSSTFPGCNPCDFGPYIIADARLRDVYGGPGLNSAPADPALKGIGYPSVYQLLSPNVVGPDLSTIGVTRVPSEDALLQIFRHGGPLPSVSFADAVYYEVPAKSAVGLPTSVSGMFIRSPKPLTDAQLTHLAAVAREFRRAVTASADVDRPAWIACAVGRRARASSRQSIVTASVMGRNIGRSAMGMVRRRSTHRVGDTARHADDRHHRPPSRRRTTRTNRCHTPPSAKRRGGTDRLPVSHGHVAQRTPRGRVSEARDRRVQPRQANNPGAFHDAVGSRPPPHTRSPRRRGRPRRARRPTGLARKPINREPSRTRMTVTPTSARIQREDGSIGLFGVSTTAATCSPSHCQSPTDRFREESASHPRLRPPWPCFRSTGSPYRSADRLSQHSSQQLAGSATIGWTLRTQTPRSAHCLVLRRRRLQTYTIS